MADSDLPVFPFRVNWENGVIERLMFKSPILRAEEGAEQRRSVRPTPRRAIEADFLLYGPERAFFDLYMHGLSAQTVLVPFYWDLGITTAAAAMGSTDRLEFDTRWTEFEVGKLALIQGRTALEYEVVEIDAIDDDGLDLVAPVTRNWPAGSRVMPLRRGLIDEMGTLSHPTAAVAEITVRLSVAEANPWTPATDESPLFQTYRVFLESPNWVSELEAEMAHDVVRFDPEIGIPYQTDPVGRANVGQGHSWFLKGREGLASFRDLVYRHKGRRGQFWLPTFKADLELTSDIASSDTEIEVANVGMSYVGGGDPISGREYILIETWDGEAIPLQITDITPGPGSQIETIGLGGAVGQDLSVEQVRRISFMDMGRFDQDEFELQHHTDTRNLTEVSASFRTFKNSRDPSGVIELPIPEAAMSGAACGPLSPDDCYGLSFAGWYAKATIECLNDDSGLPGSNGFFVNPNGVTQLDKPEVGSVWAGSETEQFPDGVPKGVYTGTRKVEFYWVDPDVMDSTEVQYRVQFPAGSIDDTMPVRFTWQFWNSPPTSPSPVTSTIINPGQPSDDSTNPADVGDLFPLDYFLHVDSGAT